MTNDTWLEGPAVLPTTILQFLNDREARFEQIRHPPTRTLAQTAGVCGVPSARIARALVLSDADGPLLAVLPSDHLLDFRSLCSWLHRELEPLPAEHLTGLFDDCEALCCPPLGGAYGLDTVVDEAVFAADVVYVEPGSHSILLKFSTAEFQRLLANAHRGRFSHPFSALAGRDSSRMLNTTLEQFTPTRIKRRVEAFHDLPALPGAALRILDIARNPRADAQDLAAAIEQDAPLAARILRYANSPLYGYPGKIKDLRGAIARVLGFDFVLNLALGITIGKSLHIPTDGPLGLDAFWRHSVYAASLVERLATLMPAAIRPNRGTAYLAGLLHDMGILLLGHAFQTEFFLLNRYLAANPDVPLETVEKYLLGVGHDQIGAWLLAAWGLPEELVTAAHRHHDEAYRGDHALYAQLVLIANRLLARHGIGTGTTTDLPAGTLEMLGLSEQQVAAAAEALWTGSTELDDLARMVA